MRGRWASALLLLLLASADPVLAGGRRKRARRPEPATPAEVPAPASEIVSGSDETPAPRRREWLERHQSEDGSWDADRHRDGCERDGCPDSAAEAGRVETTGLVLLAFLGYGETHKTPRYGDVVRRGLLWLKGAQGPDGVFGPRHGPRYLREHAIATGAIAELAAMTQSALVIPSARAAAEFLLSRRGHDGGWAAGDGSGSDAVTTAWAIHALRFAQRTGVKIEDAVFRDALAFYDSLREGAAPPRPELAAAAALWARVLCDGPTKGDAAIDRWVETLLRSVPTTEAEAGVVDPEYWFLAASALQAIGGTPWRRWNESMKRAIIDTQVRDKESCRYGSWDPVPGRSAELGRVASTALHVLCLEVYYRYSCVLGTRAPDPSSE